MFAALAASTVLTEPPPAPPAVPAAPEWVHLIPLSGAGGLVTTHDGRGPYRVADAAALATLAPGERLVIDENHATDLAAPAGRPAPARGWIVELAARADGIWGRVEWTEEGRRLVESRAYRAISPVVRYDRDGNLLGIARASLVNNPNLRGLTALHRKETTMEFMAQLRAALGLDADADEAAILAAAAPRAALQAALAPIARAAGLNEGAGADAVIAGVEQLATAAKAGGDATTITALQAELAGVAGELQALREDRARAEAEHFVDAAIAAGRVGVKPLRARYIAMHMADPAGTAELINALPSLGGGTVLSAGPPGDGGGIALNAAQLAVARMMGHDPKDVIETLRAEREAAL